MAVTCRIIQMILVQSIGSQWSHTVELLLLPDPVNIQKTVKFRTVDLFLTESFLDTPSLYMLFLCQINSSFVKSSSTAKKSVTCLHFHAGQVT